MRYSRDLKLWGRWVGANSLAEAVGLGATFAVGALFFSGLAEQPGFLAALLSAILMTSSGAIEGIVVGLLQWWAMRPAFPGITARSWTKATVIGALAAWLLGSLPMLVLSLGQNEPQGAAPEPSPFVTVLLAGLMGLVAGAILGLPQWHILRRQAHRASLWIAANSLAWAAGMPIIFLAIDLALVRESLISRIAVMAGALLLTGAVVGAIHGAVLVRLARLTAPAPQA